MIKQISLETFHYYSEEFHTIIKRISESLNDLLIYPHTINNPEASRDPEKIRRSFNNGLNIGFSADFIVEFPEIDQYSIGPIIVPEFEDLIRDLVSMDDEALYVVSYRNLRADYNFSTGNLCIKFTIYTPNRYVKV